jgi:hypothetical protein
LELRDHGYARRFHRCLGPGARLKVSRIAMNNQVVALARTPLPLHRFVPWLRAHVPDGDERSRRSAAALTIFRNASIVSSNRFVLWEFVDQHLVIFPACMTASPDASVSCYHSSDARCDRSHSAVRATRLEGASQRRSSRM